MALTREGLGSQTSNMSRQAIVPSGAETTYQAFHFAPAIRDGDLLWCSGQTGTGADGKNAASPEEQFAAAFEDVRKILEHAGASFADVVEMTTFHVGFNEHIAAFMRVKDRYVKEPYPAWTAIGVSELAFGSLVEVKVVARIGAGG